MGFEIRPRNLDDRRIVPQVKQINWMTNSLRLAAVRLRLEQWLVDQSGSDGESPRKIRSESILIRDGFYCGRQFDAGDHRAVWFIEEDELKISTSDGKWVCTLQGDQLTPQEPVSTQVAASSPADVSDEVSVERPEVIAMTSSSSHGASSQPLPGSAPDADVSDDHGAEEQEIRRAA